jgi:putative SOS response-associated peptidase YedK
MCGRFTLRVDSKKLATAFLLPELSPFPRHYNIAPTQPIACVRESPDSGQRELVALRWGLIPSWAKDAAIGNRMINARSESAADKPSFRTPFKNRRCLIPADGFYEWKKLEGRKQPFYITRRDSEPFAFAGLWDQWANRDDGEVIESTTILTTEASEWMKLLQDRMPVILDPKDYGRWLDIRANEPAAVQDLQGDELVVFTVSSVVNTPRNDSPKCVEEVGLGA